MSSGLSIGTLAYIAGLFDGEGTAGINRKKQQRTAQYLYQCQAVLVNNNREILIWIQQMFGGSIYKRNYPDKKAVYNWRVVSREAQFFLRNIEPFSKLKIQQIRLALALQKEIDDSPKVCVDNPINKRSLEQRENLFQHLRILNQRGIPTLAIQERLN